MGGFRATPDGTIISHKGKAVGSDRGDGRIVFISIADENGLRRTLLSHRFIAYQLYGDKMFEPGIVVRHLNDDPSDNRFENIALGTHKDNERDAKKNNIKAGPGKYNGSYGAIYRYYMVNGWSKTMKDLNLSYKMLAYVKTNYTPTTFDKIALWAIRKIRVRF